MRLLTSYPRRGMLLVVMLHEALAWLDDTICLVLASSNLSGLFMMDW